MVMAKITTQMAVEDGGGEYCSVTRSGPSAGTRLRQSPFAERPRFAARSGVLPGASWIVVAMTSLLVLLLTGPLKKQWTDTVSGIPNRRYPDVKLDLLLIVLGLNLLRRRLHDVITDRAPHAVLVGIVI